MDFEILDSVLKIGKKMIGSINSLRTREFSEFQSNQFLRGKKSNRIFVISFPFLRRDWLKYNSLFDQKPSELIEGFSTVTILRLFVYKFTIKIEEFENCVLQFWWLFTGILLKYTESCTKNSSLINNLQRRRGDARLI